MKPEHLKVVCNSCSNSMVAWDLGANNGSETHLLREIFKIVVSVEADPDLCKKFEYLLHMAIADHDGETDWYASYKEDGVWDASGSVLLPTTEKNYPWLKFRKSVSIPCCTLDTLAETLGHFPNFIHGDLQGAERFLFEYGKVTLANTEVISLELSEGGNYKGAWSYTALIAALKENKYEHVATFGPDQVWRNTCVQN